ncbi:c-type cytochrome [Niveibacterium terrae]|uniref:c-type cytochrome n=1 Tax=Niveibacterium terrae TaxID=3373598 RepID=UPI003A8D590C
MRLAQSFAALALLAPLATLAATDADLARMRGCFTCHTLEGKAIGPSFKDIARRYKADKGAESRLAVRIRNGGSGAWGKLPMPASPLTEAEARQLARWTMGR